MMEREVDPEQLTEDWKEGIAAVPCPSCDKVYVFSKFGADKKGRSCPKCGRSVAIFKKRDGRLVPTVSLVKGTAKTKPEPKTPEEPELRSKNGRLIILK